MDGTDWLARVAAIRRASLGGARAPHKPLLLLYALGRLATGQPAPIRYRDSERDLSRLLEEFGPPNPTSPAYPFFHLGNDEGLWQLDTSSGEPATNSAGTLRKVDAVGRLDPAFEEALRADPALVVLIARYLLEDNWPESLHDDIVTAVGLDLDRAEATLTRERLADEAVNRRRRDARFRELVLIAYEYRCAFCGYDGRIDNAAVALDAAHVRWWAADGPDEVANALCLCAIHHRLLDKGVLGVTDEHTVQVSKRFVGTSPPARSLVIELAGRALGEPQRGEPSPRTEHVQWHGREVFRAPARAAS